jgi:hypothetical protein
MSPSEALETLKSYYALYGGIGHIDIYRRQRDRKIVCLVYDADENGIWYWKRRARHMHLRCAPEPELLFELPWWHNASSWTQDRWPLLPAPISSIGSELAAITRRAFVPRLFTQIYTQHPLAGLLKSGKPVI